MLIGMTQGVAMNYTESRLIRLTAAIGASLWLARLIFSRNARNEVDAAMRAIDDATSQVPNRMISGAEEHH
jgi:hypothetical protein